MELELQHTIESILQVFRNVSRRVSQYEERGPGVGNIIQSLNQTHNLSDHGFALDYACGQIFAVETTDVLLVAKICLYICLILVLVGVTGNIMNIVVVYNYMKKHSSSVYILLLAISDSIYLVLTFLGPLLKMLKCFHFRDTKLDFINFNDASCKLVFYIGNAFNDFSSSLILCFTFERTIAVFKPMKVNKIFTVKRTKMLCFCLLLFIMTLLAPYYLLTIGVESNIPLCTVVKWKNETAYLYLAETLIFRVVPVLIIASLNICILRKVWTKEPIEQHRGTSRKNQSTQLTALLILISSSYVVLYLPLLLSHILWSLWANDIKIISDKALHIIDGYARTLYVAGFAINCYLYILGSQMFRDNVRKTFSSIRYSVSNSFRSSDRVLV